MISGSPYNAQPVSKAAVTPSVKGGQLVIAIPGNPAAHGIALVLLLTFLFLAYSRVLDYTVSSLHLPLVVSTMALLFAGLSGGLLRVFRSRIGILMLLYLGWMGLCVPFAFWKGGSANLYEEYCKSFLVFVLIVASLRRSRDVKKACYAIAFAMIGVALLCFTVGVADSYGRLSLVFGLFGNSNDLAMVLLVGLPFWILFGDGQKGTLFRSLIAAVVILVMLFLLVKTGSRAALLGVVVIFVMFFLSVSIVNKLKLAVGGAIALGVILVATPTVLRDRFATVLSQGDATDKLTASAMASTSQRTELLKRSIALTLRHPLLGVGPGNFQPASAAIYGNDMGSAWLETHNAITQISSELGIPGLLLFCGVLFCCFRSVWRVFRWKPDFGKVTIPAVEEHIQFLKRMGFCLLLSLTSLTLTSFFSSIAYQFYFPTLIGLCAALEMTANAELKALFPATVMGSRPLNAAALAEPNLPGRLRPAI